MTPVSTSPTDVERAWAATGGIAGAAPRVLASTIWEQSVEREALWIGRVRTMRWPVPPARAALSGE
jgi:hypothetical protein